MNVKFSWFEVALLVGITQGLLISFLIWLKKNQSVSKVLLSLVLIVFSLLCVRILILTSGLWQNNVLRYFPLPFELAIAPLFWLYVLSLVNPRFSFKKSILLHFLPFGISLAYSVVIYCLVLPEESNIEKDIIANAFLFNEVKRAEDYLGILSAVVYWLLGFRLVMRYRRWLAATISSTDFPTYAWLKNITFLLGLLIILLSTDVLLDSIFNVGFRRFTHWKFFFVYCASLIYYLGFRGYQLPDKNVPAAVARDSIDTTPVTLVETEPAMFNHAGDNGTVLPEKTAKLSNDKAAEIEKAIRDALETHALYLDPELNLEKLAKFNSPFWVLPTIVASTPKQAFTAFLNP